MNDTVGQEETETINEINGQNMHLATLGLPPDSGRDARIAQRKNRIEQHRLQKSKPTGNTDGIHFSLDYSVRRTKKVETESSKEAGKSKTQISISKKRIDSTRVSFIDKGKWK